jgi:integrase
MITKVNFYIQTTGKAEASVRARITWLGNSITYSLGLTWPPSKWRKGNPIGTNADGVTAARAKAEMAELQTKCIDLIRDTTTEAEAKALLRGKEAQPTATIADITRKYLASRNLAYNSVLNVRRVMSQLANVCGATATAEGVESYISQCRQRLKAAAANTYVTILTSVISWANAEGLTNIRTESRPERAAHNQLVFLTEAEVRQVAEVQLPDNLQAERDRFLLQCLTGLRASDIAQLTATIDNGDHIELTLIKTGQTVRIPINEQTRDLLNRVKSNRVPPTPQRVRLIKRICQLAKLERIVVVSERRGGVQTSAQRKLWEVIGTHTARRTFISRLINAGVSADVVMSMTGHRNYSGIRPYIGITDSTKSAALDLISI